MATALSMIARSMRLIRALGRGETPESHEATDALAALNTMLESWGLDNLSVFHIEDVTLSWPGNQQTRTIGATGDFALTRPVEIRQAVQRKDDIDYPVNVLQYDEWFRLVNKNVASDILTDLYYEPTYPDATIHVFPRPNTAVTLILLSTQPLQSFATLETTVSLPPGYERAIIYSLAMELAPEFGRSITQEVRTVQEGAMRAIRSKNYRPGAAQMEPAQLTRNAHGWYDVSGDTYR